MASASPAALLAAEALLPSARPPMLSLLGLLLPFECPAMALALAAEPAAFCTMYAPLKLSSPQFVQGTCDVTSFGGNPEQDRPLL